MKNNKLNKSAYQLSFNFNHSEKKENTSSTILKKECRIISIDTHKNISLNLRQNKIFKDVINNSKSF